MYKTTAITMPANTIAAGYAISMVHIGWLIKSTVRGKNKWRGLAASLPHIIALGLCPKSVQFFYHSSVTHTKSSLNWANKCDAK